jgi:YbbR domain-containing protein
MHNALARLILKIKENWQIRLLALVLSFLLWVYIRHHFW